MKKYCMWFYNNSQPFYTRLCNGVHEKKSTPFRHKKYHGCYEHFYKVSDVRDTSFCDVIANIFDEMVLKNFINIIAKLCIKRLSVVRCLQVYVVTITCAVFYPKL